MLQTAVFIDAGYLYAQGSALLGRSKLPRDLVRLNVPVMLQDLLETAQAVEPRARLLRVYWYDGLRGEGFLKGEQRILAGSENVKCRFGTVNKSGEQKGVDSLIITDMIELSRSHAISDAMIMSGDEDIRVGVQIAQSFGIRVHLLGIDPARGSQSPGLRAEADTLHEWTANTVSKWMKILKTPAEAGALPIGSPVPVPDKGAGVPPASAESQEWMAEVIKARVQPLAWDDAQTIYEFAEANGGRIPKDFDAPSLGLARDTLGRQLSSGESKRFRTALLDAVRQKIERAED